jgi:hypothetical protein
MEFLEMIKFVYCYFTCPSNEQLSSIKNAGGKVVGKIANKK